MRWLLALALPLIFAGSATAQTLGVTGVNDYWLTPGGLPGGLSCKSLTFVTPGVINLNVSAAPNTSFYSLWFTCGCHPCSPIPAMGISSCLPPPTTACPSTNQFLEVGVLNPCVHILTICGVTNGAGLASIPIFVPAGPPFFLSTQTILLGPNACLVSPWSMLFSQGWNVTFL